MDGKWTGWKLRIENLKTGAEGVENGRFICEKAKKGRAESGMVVNGRVESGRVGSGRDWTEKC